MRINTSVDRARVLRERDILIAIAEFLNGRVDKRHVENVGLYLLLIVFWGLVVYLSLAFALP